MDNWLPWLLIGLIAGWLLEYLIDIFFWRPRLLRLERERDRFGQQADAAESGIATLRERLRGSEREKHQLEQARFALGERLQTALRELKTLRAQHDAAVALGRQHEEEASVWRTRAAAGEVELDGLRARIAALQTALADSQREIARLSYFSEPPNETPVFTSPSRRDPLEEISGIGRLFAERLYSAGITSFEQLGRQTPDAINAVIQPQPWQKIEPEMWIAEATQRAHNRRNES